MRLRHSRRDFARGYEYTPSGRGATVDNVESVRREEKTESIELDF